MKLTDVVDNLRPESGHVIISTATIISEIGKEFPGFRGIDRKNQLSVVNRLLEDMPGVERYSVPRSGSTWGSFILYSLDEEKNP